MHASKIVLVAGGHTADTNLPATEARLIEPFGCDFDAAGNLFIVEMETGNRLLKVDLTGTLTHVAGRPEPGDSGDGGSPLAAQFNGPHNLAVLPNGDVLIADTWNGRVRRVDLARQTVGSVKGFAVASAGARTAGPYCISLDRTGTRLYVCDLLRVHALDLATGASRVVAGNGEKGIPVDGALAVEAPLADARAAAVDRAGNLYILERNAHALRVVDREGRIRTVVNTAGEKGFGGDGGDARLAQLNGPKHLCIDAEENVLIADTENSVIRKYLPATGRIERVAGTGEAGSAGLGGAPTRCQLHRPHGVTIHRDGTLYITDSYNHRVLKLVP